MPLVSASLAAPKTLSVALIGPGGVGSAVLTQLSSLAPRFKLVSISNSRLTLHSASGLSWSSAKADLLAQGKPLNIETELVPALAASGDPTVVVDNTSDAKIAGLYPLFLSHGLHVATPNKVAFSSALTLARSIEDAAKASGALVYRESTVGAGLPIVSTLGDLVATGDEVWKIEGVLSGTMSFIFNEFSRPSGKGEKRKFSEIVRDARDKGYTEPHPAADLSGSDVARKLSILSRLIPCLSDALPEGYASVSVQSLIPAGLEDASIGAEAFLDGLEKHDAAFEDLRAQAERNDEVLRFVGVIDVQKKEIKAGLERYPSSHPLASLTGSDNILLFHTARYGPRPLIVQGAGAGADVTAMGVVSDLIKIAERI